MDIFGVSSGRRHNQEVEAYLYYLPTICDPVGVVCDILLAENDETARQVYAFQA